MAAQSIWQSGSPRPVPGEAPCTNDSKMLSRRDGCTPCPALYMEASGGACACKAGYVSREHRFGLWGRDESCIEQSAWQA